MMNFVEATKITLGGMYAKRLVHGPGVRLTVGVGDAFTPVMVCHVAATAHPPCVSDVIADDWVECDVMGNVVSTTRVRG